MLTIEAFKKRFTSKDSPHWLCVGVDTANKAQFYIIVNGGMGTTLSAPIERYDPAIKAYIIDMLDSGELVMDEERNLLCDRNILVHYLSQSPVYKEDS